MITFEQQAQEHRKKVKESKVFLEVPQDLTDKEKAVWIEIADLILANTQKVRTIADRELLRQYCKIRVVRDTAWDEYNKNPELYIKIVTGIDKDGKTPKVTIKENGYYKTFTDCNKQFEKIIKELQTAFGRK